MLNYEVGTSESGMTGAAEEAKRKAELAFN